MKEHALPQDVTGYKFHIIGNMTLKQFAEVAAGVGVGFFIYFTNLPTLVKWPLILLFAGAGALAAFIPFEERPLDHWILTFFKALYRPTQFYWKRTTKVPEPFLYESKKELQSLVKEVDLTPVRRQRVKDYLHTVTPEEKVDQIDVYSNQRLNEIMGVFDEAPGSYQPVPAQAPTLPPATEVVQQAAPVVTPEPPTITEPVPTPAPIPSIDAQIPQNAATISFKDNSAPQSHAGSGASALSQLPDSGVTVQTQPKNPNMQEVNKIAASLIGNTVTVPAVQNISVTKTVPDEFVERTSPQAPNQVGDTYMTSQTLNTPANPQPTQVAVHNTTLPFPAKPIQPNKLVGMVVDSQNVPVSSVIIEILTSAGVPARAVKTNILGQFFITTPLGNGTYTITAEKAGYTFPPQSLELTGQVMDPIEIRST